MPIFLFILMFFGLEGFVLLRVWDHFGFVNTVFALFLSAIFGAGLARTQGRFILRRLQDSVARGEMPADQVLHGMLVFIGALLFIFPGFISDFIGLLFVLPGFRHLFVKIIKRRFTEKIQSGQFRVFTFGSMNMRRPQEPGQTWARDVTPQKIDQIIDVRPISSVKSSQKDERDSGQ